MRFDLHARFNLRALFNLKALSVALAAVSYSTPVVANEALRTSEAVILAPVVVTGASTAAPLTVETRPKTPRQPVPAHDGADYLKTIPGFSVVRKGGTDGDPQFRGLSGSRLGILVDGESVLGGCDHRMDAPTAYIYPELYDSLTVIKGPQTVSHGPGHSAATVLFEREVKRFEKPEIRLHAGALAGSAGRQNLLADVQTGTDAGYLQVTGSDARADDYRDGRGDKIHSQYHRYSGHLAMGLTPDENTRLEWTATTSDGEAAYADRGMDGTQFKRESQQVRLERKALSPLIGEVSLHAYQNSVDHIMDDQELRDPGMMGYANLARETDGARFATTLSLGEKDLLTVGTDTQHNVHRSRRAGVDGRYSAWMDDANFNQYGLFTEWERALNEQDRLITGYRSDRWEVTDERPAMVMTGMMPPVMSANPSSGQTRKETLGSGFARVEKDLAAQPATLYAGLGYVERFPDYWELIAKQGDASFSAFNTRTEKTRQLDVGALYQRGKTHASVSAFYSKIQDYILIDYTRMQAMSGYARNIDATLYGAEISGVHALTDALHIDSALAWTWGANDTDDTALAQISPLEARLGLTYTDTIWSTGALLRMVDDQDRYDAGRGTIVGQDFAPGGGFSVFSVNAAWKMDAHTQLSAGVDNAFNKTYAEFISRAGGNGMGGAIPGYAQTDRVNEPGRTLWAKLQWDL